MLLVPAKPWRPKLNSRTHECLCVPRNRAALVYANGTLVMLHMVMLRLCIC
jgi:hypothetical protein